MSIVAMSKVCFLGHGDDKAKILADLQEIGCLHLIPLTEEGEEGLRTGPSPQAHEALKFLLSCPFRRRQVKHVKAFDPLAVQNQALKLQCGLQDLYDERDFLIKRIRDLKPWGDFTFPPLGRAR